MKEEFPESRSASLYYQDIIFGIYFIFKNSSNANTPFVLNGNNVAWITKLKCI